MRPSALDELDEQTPPPPLPLRRPCSKAGCRRSARPGGRYCRPCATDATRAWRERHKDALRERERARTWSNEERAVRKARALVAIHIKRGKLQRGRCESAMCRDPHTMPAWDNPRLPLEVRWFCRSHYDDRRDAAQQLKVSRAELAEEWAQLRDEVALLPPAVRAELHARALAGPVGHGCKPGSIFYWWTLRRELARYHKRTSGSWSPSIYEAAP